MQPCIHAFRALGRQPSLKSAGIAMLQSFPCLPRMRIWSIMYFGHGAQLCLLLSWLAVRTAVSRFWTWHSGSSWVRLQCLHAWATVQSFQETHVTSCYLRVPRIVSLYSERCLWGELPYSKPAVDFACLCSAVKGTYCCSDWHGSGCFHLDVKIGRCLQLEDTVHSNS